LSYAYPVYVIGKENSKSFFLRACASWWPLASSVTISTQHEQVQCVLWLTELQSLTAVQRRLRTQYGREHPIRESIRLWDNKLRTTGSLLRAKSPERHGILKEMSIALKRHPSEVRSNQFVLLACITYIFHVQQCTICYTKAPPKNVQGSNDSCSKTEWPTSTHKFCCGHARKMDGPPVYLRQVCFSDEATFHVNGVVNRYYCRIRGSQNPHITCELERGSPKVNVWAGLMHDKLIGPFFFSEMTVTGHAGAVRAASVTTSNYPPSRWGVATLLLPC
jgi:hypothetical protein